MKELDSLMHLRFLYNLTSLIAFKETFGLPVIWTPIPGIGEARAFENMINCQVVGVKGPATPYHGTHPEFVFFYV